MVALSKSAAKTPAKRGKRWTCNPMPDRKHSAPRSAHFSKPAFAALAFASLAFGGGAFGQAPPLSPRVQQLLSQLTLDEKLAITQGGKDPAYVGQIGYTA